MSFSLAAIRIAPNPIVAIVFNFSSHKDIYGLQNIHNLLGGWEVINNGTRTGGDALYTAQNQRGTNGQA
ncbi:hypothetical protein [Desulfoplanes formicivorans]|uniref:Uncharacterized protein n=1 Tax=Desulfoplanes formicivorans TaxID=1592317 RepID=A0A194AK49_9BACT|nr:hypothetical protein [Desulfoplanes formicivorans]GAU09094.1 hypothetical protein DPF_1814 [Desulfoplanes formicivorans]